MAEQIARSDEGVIIEYFGFETTVNTDVLLETAPHSLLALN